MTLALRPFFLLALISGLTACATATPPRMERNDTPMPSNAAASDSAQAPVVVNGKVITPTTELGEAPHKASSPQVRAGNGQLINQRVAASPPPTFGSTGQATFNFEGESLQAVVKAILGDLLQQNYVIAPGVQGTVTLSTPRPVDSSQALSLLEMVLGWNNARLVWSDGRANIVPADQAVPGNLSPRTGSAANARGYELRAVPLKYISATEMEKLLKPYARDHGIVQVDNTRNLLVIGGTRAELQNYLRTIEIFDVDWLAGMSIGVYPLQSAEAGKVVTSLDKVFGESGKTPMSGMFRFMPLEGQNAVMVITTQASYLREVESFIERLDTGGDGARLYVYEVQYVKAADLADQLGSVFGQSGQQNSSKKGASLMPGLDPVEVRTTDMPAAKGADIGSSGNGNTGIAGGGDYAGGKSGGSGGNSNQTLSIGGSEVGISAVEESNSLLIRTNPAQWESIRRAIERLDTMPLQVHIEAQVVEVKLNDQLKYGVSWFFGNLVSAGDQAFTKATSFWDNSGSSVKPDGTGTFTFLGPNAQAIISTLDSVSNTRILSAPSVLVRNNVEADFNSGTQIPVASTIINNNGNTNNDDTYSQVQFRQTGVSLKVKPRISSNGMVFLEITQDVSSISDTGPVIGGNVSVDNRKLHTEVAVRTGETVMIAGLIQSSNKNGSSGLPGLSRLPYVGALFGAKERGENRAEVVVLITPTVIHDPSEARKLTDEYGERFRGLDPLRKPGSAPKKK